MLAAAAPRESADRGARGLPCARMARSLPSVLLICTALAGCGQTPKERFISRGDKACGRLADRFEHLATSPITPTPGALLGNTREYRDLTRELHDRLAASARPHGVAPSRIVDLAQQLTSDARRLKVVAQRIVAAAERRDEKTELRDRQVFYDGAVQMQSASALPLQRRMRAYGFKRCPVAGGIGFPG